MGTKRGRGTPKKKQKGRVFFCNEKIRQKKRRGVRGGRGAKKKKEVDKRGGRKVKFRGAHSRRGGGERKSVQAIGDGKKGNENREG